MWLLLDTVAEYGLTMPNEVVSSDLQSAQDLHDLPGLVALVAKVNSKSEPCSGLESGSPSLETESHGYMLIC